MKPFAAIVLFVLCAARAQAAPSLDSLRLAAASGANVGVAPDYEAAKTLADRAFEEALGASAPAVETPPAENSPMPIRRLARRAEMSVFPRRLPPPPPKRGFTNGFEKGFSKTLKPAFRLFAAGFEPVRGTLTPSPAYYFTTAGALLLGLALAPVAALVGVGRGLYEAVR